MSDSIERRDRDWFPDVVARFVEEVEAGTVLKTTEFAGAVSVTTSNLFRNAGACRFDSGTPGPNDLLAILLFQCTTEIVEQGLVAFIYGEPDKASRIEAISKTITPGGEH